MKLSINEIFKFLPHAYPFLLIDKVVLCVPFQKIVAIKNVTYNENFFVGHFPGRPIMPGVLIVEALAQASGICAISRDPDNVNFKDTIMYFASIEQARFRKPVIPGDVLQLISSVSQSRAGIHKFSCAAQVDGEIVAEAAITLAMKDSDS